MNLADLLIGHGAPEAAAVVDGDIVLTYSDLSQRAEGFASVLAARGVGRVDRVAIAAPNGAGFVAAYLGVLHLGAVAVPLNPQAPAPEIERELAMVDAAAVVTDIDEVATAADGRVVIALPDGSDLAPGRVATRVDPSADEPAALLFTSGTAGPPRAAVLTHANLGANLRQVLDHPGLALTPDDVALAALPFFHVFGLNVALGVTLAAGARLVVVPSFDPAQSLRVIAEHGVTVVAGVPAMFQAWAEVADANRDAFASVRLAVSGAAALDEAVADAVGERFGLVVHQGYGLTEASPIVTTTALADEPRVGSIGPPLPGVDVRLVDDDGSDVLAGDPGEIWVRGPNVFAGYWDDVDATNRVLTSDGWLRTGDLAVADERGVLSLVGRTKDVIIVSGFNVFPAEVEDTLRSHSAVVDVAVIGEPDERTGERVVAFVVPEKGAHPDVDELRRLAAGQLARYKCPARIEVVDALPRTLIGKVMHRALRGADSRAERGPTS